MGTEVVSAVCAAVEKWKKNMLTGMKAEQNVRERMAILLDQCP
jgi:hypothetical protein